jgi:O-antigen/teichoic acid export membrane protein
VFFTFFARELYRKFDKKTAIAGLKLGLPVMASALFGIVINFGDKFFLEKYSSFADLSYYYLAVSCTSAIPLIVTSMQNAWLPLFLKERDLAKNVQRTDKLMLKLFFGLLIVSIMIVVLLKILLEMHIIPIKYYQSIYILPILLFSQIISALVTMYGNYFVYFERTNMSFLSELVICILSIVLSLVLIPKYKVYAAAVVNLVSNALYLALYYFIIRAYIKKYLTSKVMK